MYAVKVDFAFTVFGPVSSISCASPLAFTLFTQVLSHVLFDLIQLVEDRQAVPRFGFLSQARFDDLAENLIFAYQDQAKLLTFVGIDDCLYFSYRFWIILYEIIERAAGHPYQTASLDHAHTVIHVLDNLKGGIDPRGFSDSIHKFILP